MQRFQTFPGNFKNALSARPTIADGLEVILQTGEHFGETLHLVAVGNSLAIDKFSPCIGVDRIDVSGNRRIFENGERAGNLFKQGRDDRKLLMIPVAFNESDIGLSDLHEVDDGFADQRIEQLMRLRGGHEIAGQT